MRRVEVSKKASKVDGIHTKSYHVQDWLAGGHQPTSPVLGVDAIDLGRLIGYLNPSHVTHQRLLLQFLSAPEDGSKKRSKHVELYCSYK